MSTGSAASDAEDYETCHGRNAARKISYYTTSRYSDDDLEDDGVEGRIKHERKLSKAQQKEARQSQRNAANARERARMRVLSKAFSRLKTSLPWVPADTKLSKLDTLRLASSYISHLRQLLQDERFESRFAHPVNLVRNLQQQARVKYLTVNFKSTNSKPNYDAYRILIPTWFRRILTSTILFYHFLLPHKSESHLRCAGCVSLLLNHLCFPSTDVAIHDDRAIREQPRHPILCKTLWCNSMRLPSSNWTHWGSQWHWSQLWIVDFRAWL